MRKILILILLFTTPLLSADSNYDMTGSIDRIDFDEGKIIVRDKAYSTNLETRIYSTRSRAASLWDLSEGNQIGLRFFPASNGSEIAEIWILE